MKKSQHISRKHGFTLIELLIVIGILGILAAGLLAALDPIDQLRKSRDSTRRSVAVEFTNAANRFYAQTGQFPWGTAATASTDLTSANGLAEISQMTAANEIKTTFANGIPTGRTIFFYSDVNQNAYTCFQQESRAPNQADQYTNTGAPPPTGAACSGTNGGTACWFCAR